MPCARTGTGRPTIVAVVRLRCGARSVGRRGRIRHPRTDGATSARPGCASPLRLTLLALGITLIAAGRLVDAEACYDEAAELTIAVGLDPALFHRLNGELLAWQGKSEEARATVRTAMEDHVAAGYDVYEYIGMQAIAAIELSAGNYDAVRRPCSPATTTTADLRELGPTPADRGGNAAR